VNSKSSNALLQAAYTDLGYDKGDLWRTDVRPSGLEAMDWVEKGDWLTLAKQVGAEAVLFVKNNPVIVFARCDTDDANVLRQAYNRIWCMARPRLLFLAKPTELAAYDLSREPVRTPEDWQSNAALAVAGSAAEVARALKAFRIDQLESGRLFEETRFGDLAHRADKALIQDLKATRAHLMEKGLTGDNLKHAHALIGRSIFIRYLEDRNILTPAYFRKVAGQNRSWRSLLDQKPVKPDIEPQMQGLLYPRVLGNKEFTYALFRSLARDFNGDMFPEDPNEENAVRQEHLSLLQGFLRGDTEPQQRLFFFAYRFNIIPIELISSIYEEFYNAPGQHSGSQGTYYTPPALVEFLLSQVLTPVTLADSPRILDPACGSGIFLVETFRRIVRYRVHRQARRLTFAELRSILRDQIGGIDISAEAIRAAAFSLYLAMLHYLEPSDILKQIAKEDRLPRLIANEDAPDKSSLHILLAANAFELDSDVQDAHVKKRFSSGTADIVVANPPWGAPRSGDLRAVEANRAALRWCDKRGYPVGDKEPSQTFLWRALDFLVPQGVCAMLVSTGVFYKHSRKSVSFRHEWLSKVGLDSVFNFVHARRVFFHRPIAGSIAPFAAVVFKKGDVGDATQLIHYWSAKRSASVESLQAVLFTRNDLRLLRQTDAAGDHRLWKIYWWGNHRDADLIRYLEMNPALKQFTGLGLFAEGFTKARNQTKPSAWLTKYKELPAKGLSRYGPLDPASLVPTPKRVKRMGVEELYKGTRLLVKRGITESTTPKGQIVARLEPLTFAFSSSIHGIKLADPEEWRYKCILGILWSSLARYYLFLTGGSWGIWHDEIHQDELFRLPICLPTDQALRARIVDIVDRLRCWVPRRHAISEQARADTVSGEPTLAELEKQLDEALYDLYELTESQRDLIKDLCSTDLDYLYSAEKSHAHARALLTPPSIDSGTYADLHADEPRDSQIQNNVNGYIRVFLKVWNRELEPHAEFMWRIHWSPETSSMLGIVFSAQEKGKPASQQDNAARDAWEEVLLKLGDSLTMPFGTRDIFIDGLVRAVTAREIIVIKRNEKRLWTRSRAREDAEATLLQAMNRQAV